MVCCANHVEASGRLLAPGPVARFCCERGLAGMAAQVLNISVSMDTNERAAPSKFALRQWCHGRARPNFRHPVPLAMLEEDPEAEPPDAP